MATRTRKNPQKNNEYSESGNLAKQKKKPRKD